MFVFFSLSIVISRKDLFHSDSSGILCLCCSPIRGAFLARKSSARSMADKMPVHQNPFSARVSKYWRSWIEICIDSEIGKIFPLVKENVCLRWRWSRQKWDKSQEKRHKKERRRKGSSHGIRPDEGPYCSLKFNMTCAIRSIRTRLPATHPGQSNSTANIMRLLDVSLREHTCQVFSQPFYSAK